MAAPRRRPVWSRLRQGSGGTVTSLAAAPIGSGSSAVLAGTLSGLFLSPDGGQTWARAAGGIGAPYVQSAAVSPAFATDHTLLVGTVDASAFVSIDGGATWRDTFFWGATASVTSAAFSPQYAQDRLALVGTADSGVYVSANLGRTWNAQNDGLDDQQVLAVAVSPGPPAPGARAGRNRERSVHARPRRERLAPGRRLRQGPSHSGARVRGASRCLHGLCRHRGRRSLPHHDQRAHVAADSRGRHVDDGKRAGDFSQLWRGRHGLHRHRRARLAAVARPRGDLGAGRRH